LLRALNPIKHRKLIIFSLNAQFICDSVHGLDHPRIVGSNHRSCGGAIESGVEEDMGESQIVLINLTLASVCNLPGLFVGPLHEANGRIERKKVL
jgi:hypothetical protein